MASASGLSWNVRFWSGHARRDSTLGGRDNFRLNASIAVEANNQAQATLGAGSDRMNRPLEGFGITRWVSGLFCRLAWKGQDRRSATSHNPKNRTTQ